jgi:glycosyltransferase involved in cell wall biosynthesis
MKASHIHVPLFSIIIPNYNQGKLLMECLDSIEKLHFDKNQLEVILVDDGSNDPMTMQLIEELMEGRQTYSFPLQVIVNEQNKWAAETRNIGSRKAKGRYFVFLDSDDTVEPDFLSDTLITFAAYPTASWVYPSVRKFGYKNQTDKAPEFSAKKLFLENYMVVSSPMKRELWLELKGHQSRDIDGHMKLYEDWDFWQRAIGKGYFGVPIRKTLFNYRQQIKSLMTRTEEYGHITTLLSYRENWTSLLGIPAAQRKYKQENSRFVDDDGLTTRGLRFLMNKFLGRNPANVGVTDVFYYVFSPRLFIKHRMEAGKFYTKAYKMAGFRRGFDVSKVLEIPPLIEKLEVNNHTVLCTHFWWHIGGAENVFLDYMHTFKSAGKTVVDCVFTGDKQGGEIKDRFGRVADMQFDLDHYAQSPFAKLRALWAIILRERPATILNMSNPLLYLLAPLINTVLPQTRIMDLLHCEDYDDNGWFEASHAFQQFMHTRVVTSAFWKDILVVKYSEKPEKIKVIHNMLDYKAFDSVPITPSQLSEKFGIPANKRIIGFLGRFHEQKQPHIFIAVAKLMQNHPQFHFVMAGDGALLESLMPEIKALHNLQYLGPTRNPEHILPLFDVAVLPSKYEGYPVIGLECAYANIPMVVPQIVGFAEQIQQGDFGMTYEVKGDEYDPYAIQEILLYQYDELISKGPNGKIFIEAYHQEERIRQQIVGLLQDNA